MTITPNNANWMQNSLHVLKNRNLGNVTMPASHDSAMYFIDMEKLQVTIKWTMDINPLVLPNKHWEGTFDHETIPSIAKKLASSVASLIPASSLEGVIFSKIGHLPTNLAKTQDLSISEQLTYGIRCFDLRPKKVDDYWCFHHSQDGLNEKERLHKDVSIYIHSISATGPPLDKVLGDVASFMKDHKELVILNFSHYKALNMKSDRFKKFDAECYKTLVQKIKAHLDPWLYTALPEGTRLADVTVGDYLAEQGRVIVVCSGDYAINNPAPGIWGMQGCGGGDVSNSLRVFGNYANTETPVDMKQDQLKKYEDFGADDPKQMPPCDLFLLSWTLTKQGNWMSGSVQDLADKANEMFPSAINALPVPNSYDRRPNMLSLDFVGPDTGLIEAVIELNEK